ncbi:hypothetical protein FTUN_8423 [Frigoriglobus tundricola]|uniref:VOC domain-containing protein n=1 Tax=Frigoriglobus tundricola TaxID=2774151 RepID=A0A6M5Z4Z2_9BACT|nr:hypothetical protein FTUN_8423 [Frigoriglobus tundricola]
MTGPINATAPAIEAVIETAVYAADLAAAESFYAGVLGLPVIGREAGRHVFFGVGAAGVLLVFDPIATRTGGALPTRGTRAGALRAGCESRGSGGVAESRDRVWDRDRERGDVAARRAVLVHPRSGQ